MAARPSASRRRISDRPNSSAWQVGLFLAPAVLLLAVYIGYPVAYSVVRSMFSRDGSSFVGLDNYGSVFTDPDTGIALRNNLIWVLVAPALVTCLGLVFAVLTERIRWAVAFRMVLFMPMAISLFASGIIFSLVYQQDPDRGLANAVAVGVHDTFGAPAPYPGAQPRPTVEAPSDADGFTTTRHYHTGDVVGLPMVGIPPSKLPPAAVAAAPVHATDTQLAGVVWLDVALGSKPGQPDHGKRGMPGITVQAIRDGTVVATATTGDDGAFTFLDLAPGNYQVRMPAGNFAAPFRGLTWLGPALITPVIISAWIWITTGFAMTFVAAGLAAIPRDALEAARVDGATEWQVFRRVTVPLLGPVLLVVFVTLVINVLKVFDLVYVIAPGSAQVNANVLALQMWQVSFGASAGGGDLGIGSALAVLLFVLVLPAVLFNIRRFRRERR
ncbi:ABC transporter permease subunit [Amycolatopsis sp. cmx-4-61]|uniref:ABC transporter permease n=1 Tax=Amycolatopsis sp. cmx-4-61 TaxID=2790937 RepID=UPI0039793480